MTTSKIETLTDEERHQLPLYTPYLGSKAIRIIDQLTEALAAAERRGAHFDEQCAANLARAEAAEREVARLTEALAAAEKKQSDTERWRGWERDRAEAAEVWVRELGAENTTLRVNNRVLEADNADLLERRRAAESDLAALRERVARALQWADDGLEGDALAYHMVEVLRGS